MTKEDLIEFKKKLFELTDEEILLREDHLRKLATGEILGPKTGYSSIDMPSLRYCRKESIKKCKRYNDVYDLIFCEKDMNKEIVGYLDGKCNWTWKKLKDATDSLIDSFTKEGIQVGDNVLCGVTNTPEFIAAYIALVTIGAVVKLFDIRVSEKDMIHCANSSECKYAIALNQIVAPKLKNVIDETTVQKVYIMNPANSLSAKEKIAFIKENGLKKDSNKIPKIKDRRFICLTKLIKKGNPKYAKRVTLDPNRPVVKVQSSGTTGKAKTIVHPEKTMLEFARSVEKTDISVGPDQRVLVALPPWIAYGIGDAIIDAIIFDSKVELCADFEPNAVYRNIGRFTTSYAAPFHYRYLREHYDELSDDLKKKLSSAESLVTGGDKYSASENESDEKKFGIKVLNGYGNNEDWGCLTVNPLHNNKYGSVGIPMYGEIVIVYDNEEKRELTYYQVGEICALSNKVFMGYENDEEATNKTLIKHEDGKVYLHTGDLGYIDENGYVFLCGRSERVIVRLGFKISAYTIEDGISSIPGVKECIAVEVPDKEEEHVPMVFVVPEDDVNYSEEDFITYIREYSKKILKENEVPKLIKIEKSLKYTDNNKYDFRYYEKIGSELTDTVNIFPEINP